MSARRAVDDDPGSPVEGVIAAAQQFVPGCGGGDIDPLGQGLINDTYQIAGRASADGQPLVLQRLNAEVFVHPREVMENIVRVSTHLQSKWKQRDSCRQQRRYLMLRHTNDGHSWWVDPGGHWWRCFVFIAGSESLACLHDDLKAFQAGQAFGQFAADLVDLPGPTLHCTIPGFHDTPARLRDLERALSRSDAQADLDGLVNYIRSQAGLAQRLQLAIDYGEVPLRVTHNDSKVDNLLFDRTTGEALCVIDLDTVMPGTLLHDFGDLVRNGCAETTQGSVDFSLQRFSALVDGYLGSVGHCLTPAEVALLPDAGPLMALELGARFLTDYLSGDRYFKTDYPGHNLDRCRAQLELLDAMQRQRSAMVERIVQSGLG